MIICQSTGEFILVNILVFWDVSVGAILPCAACGPPEKALLLVHAATKRENSLRLELQYLKAKFYF